MRKLWCCAQKHRSSIVFTSVHAGTGDPEARAGSAGFFSGVPENGGGSSRTPAEMDETSLSTYLS